MRHATHTFSKRIGALLLCLALLASLLPTAALAAETKDTAGDFEVTGGTVGTDYTYESNVLTILTGVKLTISGSTTADRIVVNDGVAANVTLRSVSIDIQDGNAILLEDGSTLALTLEETNTLKPGGGKAGINVPAGTTLTIDGTGFLDVSGGRSGGTAGGAGIGADNGGSLGNITITGGIITAQSTNGGSAGIGAGGWSGSTEDSSITITGGNVTASAAGGSEGSINAGAVIITGGIVNVTDDKLDSVAKDNCIVIKKGTGSVYGAYTLSSDYTIQAGQTLTILADSTLQLAENVTVTNNGTIASTGTITVSANSSIQNTGTITVDGSIQNTGTIINGGAIIGSGSIQNMGAIYNYGDKGTINNTGEFSGGEAQSINYMDKNGNTKTPETMPFAVKPNMTAWTSGWYVATGNVTISTRITVTGDVHLILADGSRLTANDGINVAGENALTIYAQSAGENMGTLSATTSSYYQAGIGGNGGQSGGTITINGGVVTAKSEFWAAGIGGGENGAGGNITINGGTVTVSGDSHAAGIGGGIHGGGGTITINGGTVTATGRSAGIGGGLDGSGGTITITGGTVTATGVNGAGIGGGWYGAAGTFSTGENGSAVIIASTISDRSTEESWSGFIITQTEGKVYGTDSYTLSNDFTIPAGYNFLVSNGQTFTIGTDVTLTNNGTINIEAGGTFSNSGIVANNGIINNYGTVTGGIQGDAVRYPSTVTVGLADSTGQTLTNSTAAYGDTIIITAAVDKAGSVVNALSAAANKVDFYLGEINGGTKLGTADVNGNTAALTITLTNSGSAAWTPNVYTITADFGGGNGLATNTGSAELTVVKGTQTAPGAPNASTVTTSSVTLNKIAGGQGSVQYACVLGTDAAAPTEEASWQTATTFNDLDPGMAYTFYVRYAGNDCYETSDPSAGTTVYTLPVAPGSGAVTINHETETISFDANTLEVNTAQSFTGTVVSSGGSITNYIGQNLYIRVKAVEGGAPASESVTLTIPVRPAAPAAPTVEDKTDDSITIAAADGVQYRLGEDDQWQTSDTGSLIFDNLADGTQYTIYARKPAVTGENPAFASIDATVKVTTKTSAAAAPIMGAASVTDTTITLPHDAAWEYSTDQQNWSNTHKFTGLTAATQYTYYVRVAETETAEASEIATVTVWTAYAPPVGVQGGVNQITGVTTDLEYSGDNGTTWTACQGTTVTGLAAGEYLVRHKAGESIPASAAVTVTVTQYTPPCIPPTKPDGPSTGESDGWEDIREEIADAEKGDTITIDMGDETEVPGEIFEEVAGKDVTVEFDMGDGVSWAVNGTDVPTNTTFSDLDLGVDLGTSGISVDVINAITGELGSVQITLAHDGEFGFALTLTAPLGKENAGYWANLYHYDEERETLNFETSAQIDDQGDVALPMTHASQYAIVIDDKSHQLPFTDLGENQWYEPAVRYAYIHDIMEGMSETTFVPDKSLTRAEAVQVLYNLEGKPVVNEGTTFPDLVYEWYKPAIAWAESTGVVDGYEDGTFHPDEPVTREEFAQMLYNYAAYKGYDLSAKGDLTSFPDGDSVQDWALPAMAWANGNGLINGHDDGSLDPQGIAIRAQAASILMWFDLNLVKVE